MATQVQFRRGTTSQNNSFTGAAGELSVDTDKNTLRVHDGSTAGGEEILSVDATQTITNKTPNQSWIPASDSAYDLGSPTNKWRSLYLSGSTLYLGGVVLKDVGGVLTIVDSAGTALAGSFSTVNTTGNVTVGGDLTVNGTTTTINSTTLDVDDLNITVAKGAANAAAANGGGLTVDGAGATFNYASTGDKWTMNKPLDMGANDITTSGTFSGNASSADSAGNATASVTASRWATGRTIELTGDVTGTSGSFDGTANLSFTTALAANTVSSTELVSASTLTIYNSAGSVLKTIIGAGS